jgi:hypothetical protein
VVKVAASSKITKGPIPVSGYFFGFRTFRGCADGVCVRLGMERSPSGERPFLDGRHESLGYFCDRG